MLRTIVKNELWHTEVPVRGEIFWAYVDIVGGSTVDPKYIANLMIRGRLKENGKETQPRHAVRMYGGPGRTYMGTFEPYQLREWIEAMEVDYSALEDVMERAGWWPMKHARVTL